MNKNNYKDTLLMPKTNFELKANLKEKDKRFFQFWKDIDLYQTILKERENDPLFILHDGPPYANGQLHIGHALNKILKDIVIRRKTMEGYYCQFIPGWDCHGMPIENKILDKYKESNKALLPSQLRIESKEFALSQIEIQKKQFQTMQLLFDFKKIYMTMDNNFIINELNLIKSFALNNLISKELKITYYSPFLKTSLADAEIEYKTIQSDQIYVAFKIKDLSNYYLLIMTTTPWSLIANAAVAINPEFSYGVYEFNNKKLVIENNLAKSFFKKLNIEINKLEDIDNNKLVSYKYFHPINKEITCPIVFGSHVNNMEGTGLVHSAPYFGEDDFSLIAKYKEVDYLIMHINDDGHLNEKAGKYKDLFFLTANKEIINDLQEDQSLIFKQKINHEYPHDWRMKKPIIYRATYQWFLNLNNVKNNFEKSIDSIQSFPEWGKQRLKEMVMNREFWTLSRQRYWGVPLIFFYDENKNPVFKEEIFDYVINIFKTNDLNIWWEKETDYFLPEQFRNKNWTKETDIIDVWFDSGSSFLLFEKNQIDLYLEGNDQYRGWFNSSMINSAIYKQRSPFKHVVSHGFVLDKDMKKMSKSLNNVVSPFEIIDKFGADILRLWVANNDFFSDITISDEVIEQNINLYKMFRNKIRFILGNLSNYPKDIDFEYSELDLLILEKLNNLKVKIDQAYSVYNFNDVVKEMSIFFHNLSNFYLEVSKDTLYLNKVDDPKRVSILNVLEQILEFSLFTLAPILPVTCEEAYQLWDKQNKKTSLYLEKITINKELSTIQTKFEEKWKPFFEAKNHIYSLLEQAIQDKKINRFQEAWIQLDKKFENYDFNWKELLLVGKVTFGDGFFIKTFDNRKCLRCWNHLLIEDMKNDELCNRCFDVVSI